MIKRQFTMTFTVEMHEDFPVKNLDALVLGCLQDIFETVEIPAFREDRLGWFSGGDDRGGCEV